MGYALAMGECCACHRPFAFNPVKVPSIRIRGSREPICKECIDWANPQRIAAGLVPFSYAHDAYEPCDERELGE